MEGTYSTCVFDGLPAVSIVDVDSMPRPGYNSGLSTFDFYSLLPHLSSLVGPLQAHLQAHSGDKYIIFSDWSIWGATYRKEKHGNMFGARHG